MSKAKQPARPPLPSGFVLDDNVVRSRIYCFEGAAAIYETDRGKMGDFETPADTDYLVDMLELTFSTRTGEVYRNLVLELDRPTLQSALEAIKAFDSWLAAREY